MNQDTREMLELAAKACGKQLQTWSDGVSGNRHIITWNPIHDSGQEAHMEAALEIDITWEDDRVNAFYDFGGWVTELYADHSGDKQAARRMAGTRAAAEIGRRMGK